MKNKLYYKVEGKGIPILLIHGFTGSNKSFDEVSRYLKQYFKIIRIDLFGHGNSMTLDESKYKFESSIESIYQLIINLKIKKINVIGYSLGGRTAMIFALKHSKIINKLIICSSSHGIEKDSDKKNRIRSDEKLIKLLKQNKISRFVKHWESLPLWESEKNLSIEKRNINRRIRLNQNKTGLALSLKHQGQGNQEFLKEKLSKMVNPTLILYGEKDKRYEGVSKELSKIVRKSKIIMVPQSGHNIILEKPTFVAYEAKNFILGETNGN